MDSQNPRRVLLTVFGLYISFDIVYFLFLFKLTDLFYGNFIELGCKISFVKISSSTRNGWFLIFVFASLFDQHVRRVCQISFKIIVQRVHCCVWIPLVNTRLKIGLCQEDA